MSRPLGLDPIGCREMKDLIIDLKARGKTVLMCSHLLADVQDVCDRIAALHQGELKELGRVDSLLKGATLRRSVRRACRGSLQARSARRD